MSHTHKWVGSRFLSGKKEFCTQIISGKISLSLKKDGNEFLMRFFNSQNDTSWKLLSYQTSLHATFDFFKLVNKRVKFASIFKTNEKNWNVNRNNSVENRLFVVLEAFFRVSQLVFIRKIIEDSSVNWLLMLPTNKIKRRKKRGTNTVNKHQNTKSEILRLIFGAQLKYIWWWWCVHNMSSFIVSMHLKNVTHMHT